MDFTNGPAIPVPTGTSNNNNNADSSSPPLGSGGSGSSSSNTTNSPAQLQPGQTGRVVGVVLTVVFCVLILAGLVAWFVLRLRRRRRRIQAAKAAIMSMDGTAPGAETALGPLEEARRSVLARPAPPGHVHAPQHSWDFADSDPETKAKLPVPPPSRDGERLRLQLQQTPTPSQHSHTSTSETKHDDNDEDEEDDTRSDLSTPPGVNPLAYSRPQHRYAGEDEDEGKLEADAREHVSS